MPIHNIGVNTPHANFYICIFQSNTALPSQGFTSSRISLASPSHPSSGGGGGRGGGAGRGRGGGGDRRDRDLIGQTVRIIQGPYKGEVYISTVPIHCLFVLLRVHMDTQMFLNVLEFEYFI